MYTVYIQNKMAHRRAAMKGECGDMAMINIKNRYFFINAKVR